jgi:phosphohistidine phosphatase SixA
MITPQRHQPRLAWLWPWCFWFGRCTATGVLIRHADVNPGSGTDPPLNAAGLARAQELRHVLADTGIGAIFVTHFQRSQQTAEPLASDLTLVPAVIDDVGGVVAAIRTLPSSSVALVIGHTNTLPEISAALGGVSFPAIGATEFDRLFVLARGRLTRLRYGA